MNAYEELLLNQNDSVRDILAKGPMVLCISLDKKPTDPLLRDGLHACIDLWGQYLTVEVECNQLYTEEAWVLRIKWTPINWRSTYPYWSSHGTLFLPNKLTSYQDPHRDELKWAGAID